MKNSLIKNKVVLALFLGLTLNLFSQSIDGDQEVKYRRSSLHRILIESDKMPLKDTVINAYYHAPFPDKYNNHSISESVLDPKLYRLSNEERVLAGLKEKSERQMSKDSIKDPSKADPEIPFIIEKYLKQNKIGNKLVAKWFNRQEDGSFNMDLISERGFYNASEMDFDIAKNSVRGNNLISDAGEELINNTFVVVSQMNFYSNEPYALGVYTAAVLAANKLGGLKATIAKKVAKGIYNKAKEGYSVNTMSYLYKLKWNDSIAAVFYNDLWVSKNNIDSTRVRKFDESNLFQLELVGEEKAKSLVTFSLKKGEANRTEDQIVTRATVRNIDRNYVKLQKAYEVFKTKTPLLTGGDNITAKIGLKEGLEAGDKFEVLEQILNPDTGKTEYKVKGVIKVDKKKIWDNRFYEDGSESNNDNPEITATTFLGSKNYYPGMLIRQVK